MSCRILLLNIPARGHVFPTLALVAQLVRNGHHVTYSAVGDFAGLVESAGATALRYESVDPVAVVSGEDPGRAPLAFLEENLAVLEAAQAHFAGGPPDLVMYDTIAGQAGRVLAKRWAKPAVQLTPGPASNEHYSYQQKIMEAAGPVDMATPSMLEFGEKLARLLAANGFEMSVPEFMAQPENFNIVFMPRAFQPAGDTFDERFSFIGPCLSERNFLGEWKLPRTGLPVALVSLGTVNNRNLEFFKAAVAAFIDLPWHAVISVGDGIDPDEFGPLPENIEIRRWVPHLRVLEHASLAVTHGGAGSVMEALYWGLPLIGVPSFPDAVPNVGRLVELGLGRFIRPAEVTAERLGTAVLEVAGDEATRQRAQQMQAHIRRAGGAGQAVADIEKYLQGATTHEISPRPGTRAP